MHGSRSNQAPSTYFWHFIGDSRQDVNEGNCTESISSESVWSAQQTHRWQVRIETLKSVVSRYQWCRMAHCVEFMMLVHYVCSEYTFHSIKHNSQCCESPVLFRPLIHPRAVVRLEAFNGIWFWLVKYTSGSMWYALWIHHRKPQADDRWNELVDNITLRKAPLKWIRERAEKNCKLSIAVAMVVELRSPFAISFKPVQILVLSAKETRISIAFRRMKLQTPRAFSCNGFWFSENGKPQARNRIKRSKKGKKGHRDQKFVRV